MQTLSVHKSILDKVLLANLLVIVFSRIINGQQSNSTGIGQVRIVGFSFNDTKSIHFENVDMRCDSTPKDLTFRSSTAGEESTINGRAFAKL